MKNINTPRTWVSLVFACLTVFSFSAFAQNTPMLSDAEIASVAVTANQIDIDYASIAQQKSMNASVLNFAKTMKDDHTAVINQAVALVTKLGVTPKDNAVSQSLEAGAAKIKAQLNGTSAAAFNKAYIDNEVAYHKSVIGAVETILIPQSKNAELKQLLQNVLPALKTHLSHAEMVQKEINRL